MSQTVSSGADVARLSGTSYAVLGLVRYLEPCTPYDLKRFIEKSVENFWPVPHATFYAEPTRLTAAGFLSETREAGGRRRKLYSLTAAGREALERWVADPEVAAPQLRDELMLKIFLGAAPEPLLRARIEWHERKQTELEGYLGEVRAAGGLAGMERSLIAGTEYERLMTGMLRRFLDSGGG